MPPQQPPAMPLPGAGGQNQPEMVPGAPAAAAMSAADASWLPPTVPVSAAGAKAAGAASQPGQTMVPVPAAADDGDLIEKEWVHKAKRIVEQTRQDPYKQTKELHKFRAEYMKKRYNKIIEPVEE